MDSQVVLDFWFEEIDPSFWFMKDDLFDQQIRSRFSKTYDDVIAGKTSLWRNTPQGRLAEVIVLDQFSRNMFRDTAKAFSGDELALHLAQEAVRLFSQKGLENNYKFELLHKEIIDRFGRYPHRNKILGRVSTPEEIEFLKKPGSSF
ncbi:DUF924 family protein [Bdellovibrio sp. HCB-110]|uniref:DUF924 family protein n=1 Tax=Bdellovibrio sp. HCB-110 TaxID=3391182 RepID=UPI0039B6D192